MSRREDFGGPFGDPRAWRVPLGIVVLTMFVLSVALASAESSEDRSSGTALKGQLSAKGESPTGEKAEAEATSDGEESPAKEDKASESDDELDSTTPQGTAKKKVPSVSGRQSVTSSRSTTPVSASFFRFTGALAEGGQFSSRCALRGPPASFTLANTVERVLKRNKTLAVRKLDPAISRVKVLKELGTFDDALSLQVQRQHNQMPTASQLSGAGVSESDTRLANLGYSKKFQEGSTFGVNFNNQRNETNSTFSTVNPNYASNLIVNATRPLLKNGGCKVATASVRMARIAREQSHLLLAKQVLDTISTAEKGYWDLVFARQDREVKDFNVKAAQELLAYNLSRQEAGLGSDVQVVEARASEAIRVGELEVSERVIEDAQEVLRRMMSLDDLPSGIEIAPNQTPEIPKESLSLDVALQIAYATRPDYLSSLLDLKSRDIRIKYLKNQKLPQIDLVASYAQNGLSGNYGDAFNMMTSGDFQNYTLGFQVGIPLGNRAAHADYKQSILEKRQSLLTVKALEDQINEDVTRAVRSLHTDLRRVEVTKLGADLSEQQLKAAEARYREGLIANFDLLRFQQDLATARSSALRALLNAVNSQVSLEAATGQLLSMRQIFIEDVEVQGLKDAPSAKSRLSARRVNEGFSAPVTVSPSSDVKKP